MILKNKIRKIHKDIYKKNTCDPKLVVNLNKKSPQIDETDFEKENSSPEPPPHTSKSKWSPDVVETLIDLVKDREALWNYKLPIARRSNIVTKLLWEDIGDSLKGS